MLFTLETLSALAIALPLSAPSPLPSRLPETDRTVRWVREKAESVRTSQNMSPRSVKGPTFMLVSSELTPFANKVVIGNLELLETVIYQELISFLDFKDFADKPVIIKGCADKPIPNSAFAFLIAKLQPIAKSILFGEACSTVPLYKSKK